MIINRVSALMGERRINITDLANGAGISRPSAQRLYHDQVKAFDREVLDKVCDFLGVDVCELLVHVPNDPNQPKAQSASSSNVRRHRARTNATEGQDLQAKSA